MDTARLRKRVRVRKRFRIKVLGGKGNIVFYSTAWEKKKIKYKAFNQYVVQFLWQHIKAP